MPDQEQIQRLLSILAASGNIESKTTVEQISTERIEENGKLIEIKNDSQLDQSGGINDHTTFQIKFYDCGCPSDGRKNLGGKCSICGKLVCTSHYFRCIRCRRPICVSCVRPIDGIAYCHRCSVITKILKFFRLK